MLQLFGSTVQEYYIRKLRRLTAQRKARLDKIRTPEEFKAYQQELKAKIRDYFQLPTEKTPLEPQVTGVVKGDGFTIE